MTVFIIGHRFHFETENLCRMFYPNSEVVLEYELREVSGDYIITSMSTSSELSVLNVEAHIGGIIEKSERKAIACSDDEAEYTLALCLYDCLTRITGYTPAWGLLTGVRPSKLMNRLIDEKGDEGAKEYFREKLLVSQDKTQLAFDVAQAQKQIFKENRPESFSLYVSIPFCPSRCSYCSFVSHSITSNNAKKLLVPYIENLAKEIMITAEYARNNNLRLESVYFGGGTPGVLSAEQSEFLIDTIKNNFDMTFCREFTFESGRSDTVTEEKLLSLKKSGVDRISINPQTFDNTVLELIGRKHTAEQTVEAYRLAEKIGFDSINMDLIAGLPGDTVEGFINSVDTAVSLRAENITVHSLALKRSSTLVAKENTELARDMTAAKMIDYANKTLSEHGYIPYYMYRQSRCVGNLENVGWCLPGKECLYNVYMMEEIHTVLAVGAGAVTKLKAPYDNHIERIFNYKYPYEYNTGFDTLLERKNRISEFYSTYN